MIFPKIFPVYKLEEILAASVLGLGFSSAHAVEERCLLKDLTGRPRCDGTLHKDGSRVPFGPLVQRPSCGERFAL